MLVFNLVCLVVVDARAIHAVGIEDAPRLQLHERLLQLCAIPREPCVHASRDGDHCRHITACERPGHHLQARLSRMRQVLGAQMQVIEEKNCDPVRQHYRVGRGTRGNGRLHACVRAFRCGLTPLNGESRDWPRLALVEDFEVLFL